VEDFVKMIGDGNAAKEYVSSRQKLDFGLKNNPPPKAGKQNNNEIEKQGNNGSSEIISSGKLFLNLDNSLNLGLVVPRLNLILGESTKGDVAVILKVINGEKNSAKELQTQYKIKFTVNLKRRLEEIFGAERLKWSE